MPSKVAPVDAGSTPIAATQMAEVRELDHVRPPNIVYCQEHELARLLGPWAKTSLGNHAHAQTRDVIDARSRARDSGLDGRVEAIVRDRKVDALGV